MTAPAQHSPSSEPAVLGLALRSIFGGVLMGLANLVPGISGGTMLLAVGVYERFINAIAEVTTLKLRWRSLLVLACVGVAAVLGILLLAGPVKDLVVERRWVMYSLFIGLTLGGLPVVWQMASPVDDKVRLGALGGVMLMIALAVLQATGVTGGAESNFALMFVAGLAGASAMILPGVSGGYLLLLLGQYVPILAGIEELKDALEARDLAALMAPTISVVLPVGLGVAAGMVAVSNLLRWLLLRYRKLTLGVLIGLLLGSVIGLWPFQQSVMPVPGETVIKGQLVTAESLETIDAEDWPTAFFRPSLGQLAGSAVLILVGFGVTIGISRMGARSPHRGAEPTP